MSRTIRQLLSEKGSQVWWVAPDQSARDAVRIMLEHNAGALVVRDGGRLAGIVSERDLVRSVAGRGLAFDETPVSAVMTRDVLYLSPDQTTEEAMALMVGKGVRHLPVLEGGALVGLVSVRDLIKEVISDKDFVISQLENYIRNK
jgi:CBS domain-containing protein